MITCLITHSITHLLLPVSRTLPCHFPPAILPFQPPPLLPDSLSHTVVYGTPHSIEICLLLLFCSGGRSLFCSHRTKHWLIASSVHFCFFLPSPEEAAFLTPILLPSLPLHSGLIGRGFPFFCFATKTVMITHLNITRLTFGFITRLLFAFQKGTEKGQFCWFWLISDRHKTDGIFSYIYCSIPTLILQYHQCSQCHQQYAAVQAPLGPLFQQSI